VSREWVKNQRNRWAMFCDRCRYQDPEITLRQQPLEVYRDRGWYIAKLYGDLCPKCVEEVPAEERREPFDFDAFKARAQQGATP
jgi:hypothetical protein